MMIKTKTILEVKIGERIYEMECDPNAPLGEVHDALSSMKSYIINRMAEANKPPENKDAVVEELACQD
jgi:hypothetical protein